MDQLDVPEATSAILFMLKATSLGNYQEKYSKTFGIKIYESTT